MPARRRQQTKRKADEPEKEAVDKKKEKRGTSDISKSFISVLHNG